ncbi:MAG: hypothetical protein ACE5JD_15480 [Candidatus Methylomirabilia bacterium]
MADATVKLFCATCQCELQVHLLLVDSMAHLLELKERGAASMTLQRIRQIMQLDQPN